MSENKNINTEAVEQVIEKNDTLTKREVWDQIVSLQDQLLNFKEASQAICDIHVIQSEYEDDELVTTYDTDATRDKIKTMQSLIMARETTLQKMLDYYYAIFSKLNP